MTSRKRDGFWAIADYFRTQGGWTPANAGYEFWSAFQAPRFAWSVCMKIHVLPAGEGPLAPRQFKASISILPIKRSPKEEKMLDRAGWFESTRDALTRAGYRGKWAASPFGRWGDFWKELANIAAVRREADRMSKMQLGVPTPKKVPLSERGKRSRR